METWGELGIEALQRLERAVAAGGKKEHLKLQNLRWMRGLYTKAARDEVLPVLLKDKVTVKEVEKAAAKAAHRMWVGFHWQPGNPRISPDHSMHPDPPPLQVVCGPCKRPLWVSVSWSLFFVRDRDQFLRKAMPVPYSCPEC